MIQKESRYYVENNSEKIKESQGMVKDRILRMNEETLLADDSRKNRGVIQKKSQGPLREKNPSG
jgi:hypothetical protein